MKKENENSEILYDFETNTFQYEPTCAEDGKKIDNWNSNYTNSELDQSTSDLDFNGLYNPDAFEQAMTDMCSDAAEFFDLKNIKNCHLHKTAQLETI